MINVQSTIGAAPDTQAEAGAERPNGIRRPLVLCPRHSEQRRDWLNLPDGDAKREEHCRLFRLAIFCPECQELSWNGQAPSQPADPQQQAADSYSWWRDVMSQP